VTIERKYENRTESTLHPPQLFINRWSADRCRSAA